MRQLGTDARAARREYLRRYFAERPQIMRDFFQRLKADPERYAARLSAQREAYRAAMADPARRAARRVYERERYAARRAVAVD